MGAIRGPAIFLAQFYTGEAPFDSLTSMAGWASGLGYVGVQIPTWIDSLFDLELAANSQTYCDSLRGMLEEQGVKAVDLGSYLQGQSLAFHPAYTEGFSPFFPKGLSETERIQWAQNQLIKSVDAAANLGIPNVSVMSGGFLWHMIYPWPQRPSGLVEEGFKELAHRWRPILDHAAEKGITIGYELHPGSDLFDGATFELFLDKVDQHQAVGLTYDPSHFLLQQLDYIDFIRRYGKRITAMHVKDAEFNPTGRVGVYGGYLDWKERAGRFRSLGDGQIDFKRIFSMLTEIGFDGWAILEWECCLKSPQQGAREGAPFIKKHIIETAEYAFDDFVKSETDRERNRRLLGLS